MVGPNECKIGVYCSPTQTRQYALHLCILDAIHTHRSHQRSFAQLLESHVDFPGFVRGEHKGVPFLVGIAQRGTEDGDVVQLSGLDATVSISSRKDIPCSVTHLYELDSPGFHIPLSLRHLSNVIIDEEAFRIYSQDQAIRHATFVADQLADRIRKLVAKEIDGVDDDLVGIFGSVGTSVRWRRRSCSGG